MSHGSGLVRTTCSSSGAPGPGQPSEGLLDPVYPLTQGAMLKVAQMVRGVEWPGDGYTGLHLARTLGAPRTPLMPSMSHRKFPEQPAGSLAPSLLQLPPYGAQLASPPKPRVRVPPRLPSSSPGLASRTRAGEGESPVIPRRPQAAHGFPPEMGGLGLAFESLMGTGRRAAFKIIARSPALPQASEAPPKAEG